MITKCLGGNSADLMKLPRVVTPFIHFIEGLEIFKRCFVFFLFSREKKKKASEITLICILSFIYLFWIME